MLFFFEIPSLDISGRSRGAKKNETKRKGIYNRCSGNDIPFWRMIVEEELHWLEEEKAELNKKKGIVV